MNGMTGRKTNHRVWYVAKVPLEILQVQSALRSGCQRQEVIARLADAISREGLRNPLLVRNGVFKHEPPMRVAWGATRLRALRKLGHTHAPCLIVGNLPEGLEDAKELHTIKEVDSYLCDNAHYFPDRFRYASLEYVPVVRGATPAEEYVGLEVTKFEPAV